MSVVPVRHTGMGATPIDGAAGQEFIDDLIIGDDSAQIESQKDIAPSPEPKKKTYNPLILVAIVGVLIVYLKRRG